MPSRVIGGDTFIAGILFGPSILGGPFPIHTAGTGSIGSPTRTSMHGTLAAPSHAVPLTFQSFAFSGLRGIYDIWL